MQPIIDIRRENLRCVIHESFNGKAIDLANALGYTSAVYIYKLLSAKHPKPIGDDLARRIEKVAELPPNWMDHSHVHGEIEDVTKGVKEPRTHYQASRRIPIHTGLSAAAGEGEEIWDESITGFLELPNELVPILGIRITPSVHLVPISGDSMKGTYNSGDLVFVDTSISYMESDGIYLFRFDGRLFIKRLQTNFETGEVDILSDNPAYPKQRWNDAIQVLGRVLGAWCWTPT